ncbi:MAG: 2-oxoacid:acceptor oxidoreductase subunit alpha [Elusimicrobiota bacterium]
MLIKDDLSIVICGEAGQGVQTVEKLLTGILKLSGYNVFASKEYMSRVRGGSNSTQIRVASGRVMSYIDRIDILIPLDKDAIPHLEKRVSPQTIIIGDKEKLGTDKKIIDVPFEKIALGFGKPIYANTVAAGIVLGLLGAGEDAVNGYLEKLFGKKGEEVVKNNIGAAAKGYEIGRETADKEKISIDIRKTPSAAGEMLITGSEAVSLGAIAGGCNFISAYPMTPSTSVLTYLSQHASEFGIVAEQAEDEVAAINMSLGAWYAGARALVSTAGGGFALMVEGLSLAGAIESPAVIIVGQRPAPATGLPTRTEQGDLEFVLYSGHGEFPRAVFAPGTIEEAFYLAQKSFNLADKYQVPVIILVDQYLMDIYYNTTIERFKDLKVERFTTETAKDYKRYRITADGISPRGIPGRGEGFVCADSDEHDESGRITEDAGVRKAMVEKRLKKLEYLAKDAEPPVLAGKPDYKTLVVGWGSTFGVIKEALEKLGDASVAHLHFSQVYPVHPETSDYLKKAKKLVIVENNATSQFGKLLKLHTGIEIKNKILKYDGSPFSAEEIVDKLSKVASGPLTMDP